MKATQIMEAARHSCLVKAMQEQQQMIVDMKKRIDLLEEQNKILQQLLSKKN